MKTFPLIAALLCFGISFSQVMPNIKAYSKKQSTKPDISLSAFLKDSVAEIRLLEINRWDPETLELFKKGDLNFKITPPETIIRNYGIDSTKIDDYKILPREQWKALEKTFVLPKEPQSVTSSGCYEPHHGILFFNSNHQLISYFEICFMCSGFEMAGISFLDGDNLPAIIYSNLKAFFIENGFTIKEYY